MLWSLNVDLCWMFSIKHTGCQTDLGAIGPEQNKIGSSRLKMPPGGVEDTRCNTTEDSHVFREIVTICWIDVSDVNGLEQKETLC